jgi:valyl-tRNA synthetase
MEMDKAYNPKIVEDKLTQFWEKGGFFKANAHSQKIPYTIVIPPPNVTGVLHMGHALVDTLQDILIRWKRMCGFEALWVPGTDHAGIATQTVVERHLMKTQSKRRSDFSREAFLDEVWKWKDESERQILTQIKKVGCSCDWDRYAFTMDDTRSKAVHTMFKKMFDDGMIYRGDYLVNWDPVSQTALADDEVEYEDKVSTLYYIRYPIIDSDRFVVVATVRPETMFGDTAVAVSPQDHRFEPLIGKRIKLPFTDRIIPIIGDPHVDPKFGTGVVKITPAHDPNDYAMASRHNLPLINVMTPDGKLNEHGGIFAGLPMEEARFKVVEELKRLGLLEKAEPHPHRVGVSYRSKAVIEPYLSKQWFVKLSAFKDKLIDLVKSDQVNLIPESFDTTYFHWIHNLRDWCISRQLWWGHRIPIWYSKDDPSNMICYAGEGLPPEVEKNLDLWQQDSDVLDTWFSSALWPFSVFGWPDKTADFEKFFPTSVLVTGHDILFFWVARMMMMSQYAFEKPPFKDVFLHGLIYGKSFWRVQKDGSIAYLSADERQKYDMGAPLPSDIHSKWEKMSKSKGNILDPLEIIDAYGADAMRMALASSTTGARQIDLDRRRFEEFKNFANKVWNGARFVLMNLEDLDLSSGLDRDLLSLEDRWMLSRLNRIIEEVHAALTTYSFDKAAQLAYDFFWKEFCAYYVELTKPTLFGKRGTPADKTNKQKVLLIVLIASIRLLHPMAPFITEELFQLLKTQFGSAAIPSEAYLEEALNALSAPACAIAPYPTIVHPSDIDSNIEEEFARAESLVHAIRNIRAEMQIQPGTPSALIIVATDENLQFAKKHEGILQALVRLEKIEYSLKDMELPSSSNAIVGNFKLILPLPTELKEKEKIRLVKEQEKLIQQQHQARSQLANNDFVEKAPAHLVEKLRLAVAQAEKELFEIAQKLEKLNV